jgi:(p)ppGpp synthase/HD superfamily hydrolase
MSTLERAIALAATAHEGQIDKAGAPYILHVLRVMLRLDTAAERTAGVLHDIVEDCGWTLDRLREEGFSEEVVLGVDAVTRRESESYEDFVLRAKTNPIGHRVKMADLEDNSDVTRLSEISERDQARLDKYRLAMEVLNS